jgi:predicted nucleic acid-binding protein
MIVVSDTSPIINLAAVGQLELLKHLYSTIGRKQSKKEAHDVYQYSP